MPAKAQHLRNHANNFLKRVKKVVEQLSPQKKQIITDKENVCIQKYCTQNQCVLTHILIGLNTGEGLNGSF
jgi:hypothetical protein